MSHPADGALEAAVLAELRRVIDPASGRDLVSAGMVQGLAVKSGAVRFALEVEPRLAAGLEPLRREAVARVSALPGVTSASAVLTAHRAEPGVKPQPARKDASALLAPGVRHIIAVASGKGGVGKSTVAVNLALALGQLGRAVGVLDADVYGPSLPRLLGLNERPRASEGKRLAPLAKYGLKAMSMGFLVPEDTPVIWRGPMVMGAIEQMLRDVDWGELDVLVVDMPPGTGDAQLTLAQRVTLAGAVIVSTPQDIALIDARKGLNMFRKVRVPVLGIVENMSGFVCPHCGGRTDIFGHGGARAEAARLGCDFLGEVPLVLEIRETSDAGEPITVSRPQSAAAEAFRAIARRVAEKLAAPAGQPRIVIE